jgi:PAS domain S-box-containing protein
VHQAGTRRAWAELLVVVVLAVAAFVVSVRLGLVEHWSRWTSRHDGAGLDELGPALVVLAAGLGIYALRRYREALRHAQQLAATEQQLAMTNASYRSLFDFHPASVFALDREGVYREANAASERLSGYSVEDLNRMSFADMVLPEDLPAAMAAFEAALEGTPQQLELRVRHSAGHVVDIALVGVPIVADPETGKIVGVYGIAEDVSERKRLTRTLADALAAAEQANEAKSTFLANVSHEIRTPLTSMLGANEVLLDGPHTPEQERFLRMVERSGDRLLRLVNDVLDLARVESGEAGIELRDVDPRDVVGEVAALAGTRATAKGLDFSCRVDDSVPSVIRTDPDRLSQILTNLLDNAVKFTATGQVRLSVCAVGTEDRTGRSERVRFTVDDTGIGIAPEQQERVFEPFNQADATITRHYGGTGLGLAICRQLAQAMGGNILLSSRPGEGSSFTVSLPVRARLDGASCTAE